jgi:predicted transposase YdaD
MTMLILFGYAQLIMANFRLMQKGRRKRERQGMKEGRNEGRKEGRNWLLKKERGLYVLK